ncbi:MAG: tRNA pseudouridine(38-40) synthase TruA [bacterium]
MPNYKLLIEYDGTRFSGWQVQPDRRTVQGEIENALFVLLKERVRLTAAGRTDSGVHALEQVANFISTQNDIVQNRFLRSLNGITGPDITINEIAQVDECFNARFSAKARQYAYHIATKPLSIGRKYAYYCHAPLNLEIIQEASTLLKDTHNFEAFTKYDPEEEHYLCTIEELEWRINTRKILFRIRANRFLRHMVRRIVGTLLQLGSGKLSVDDFSAMIEHQEKKKINFTAPAKGLFLEKVFY